jgi:hypothetical protein
MNSSFLDDPNFILKACGFFFALAVSGLIAGACSQPSTPEEKVVYDASYTDRAKEDMVVLSPRPGVECYILRGRHSVEPRVMSCVVLPVTTGQ